MKQQQTEGGLNSNVGGGKEIPAHTPSSLFQERERKMVTIAERCDYRFHSPLFLMNKWITKRRLKK